MNHDSLATSISWESVRGKATLFGIGGVVLCGGAFALNAKGFYHSYLFGYLFWAGVALGMLALTLLGTLTGGRWTKVVQRPMLAGALTVPLWAVLFIPVLLGMQELYEWAHPGAAEHDPIIAQKARYLNPTAFTIRFLVYFAIWTFALWVMNRWIGRQERNRETGTPGGIRAFSAFGVVIYVYSVTFAGVDWSMSLEPHWYSTIFGMRAVVGHVLSAYVMIIIIMGFLTKNSVMHVALNRDRLHDLGNLFFGFVNIWAYLALSQFIIIWSGNLPEFNVWYLKRLKGGWEILGVGMMVLHFIVPFIILLSRKVKQRMELLFWVAVGVGVMQMLDEFWQVAPVFRPDGLSVRIADVLVAVGLGGIWLAAYLYFLTRKPLLPVNYPLHAEEHHH